MNDFAAIDLVVVVRGGEVTDRFYSLIQSEPNYYSWFCQRVHGLCHEDTDDAEVFPTVWHKIEPLIEGLPLVAHNAMFDEGCLRAVMQVYRMEWPGYVFYDTLRASRRMLRDLPNHQLHTVSEACGYCLEAAMIRHNADKTSKDSIKCSGSRAR